jgi:hypothetical protein
MNKPPTTPKIGDKKTQKVFTPNFEHKTMTLEYVEPGVWKTVKITKSR